ncbi:hypothetical protein A2803_01965 [Candidatus Woesebacteria bacterium RIFCSPHIGHO2_01_FULL_44_21]|uniref:Uncharacterized protein n=1 Tax=Candidatus Woesebacteria bacterium RIFCSPHIGHO2_01_FULL_44_21 TaxID=1802503 RepID=A0A1F7Z0D1_9BACT|nr:MAG: hypothetical protein A2803_01965 [Candidatus Woesebacteria bacterium RIFCSPHIGHO2_01_FULL_44_21]
MIWYEQKRSITSAELAVGTSIALAIMPVDILREMSFQGITSEGQIRVLGTEGVGLVPENKIIRWFVKQPDPTQELESKLAKTERPVKDPVGVAAKR